MTDPSEVTDTYDMVNEAEDPDLVSGSFGPMQGFAEAARAV